MGLEHLVLILQSKTVPRWICLIDSGTVLYFLSYGGSFTATNGTAAGMTSVDIGVSEPTNTPVGQSLQLTGTGRQYHDFSWSAPAAESPGGINAGQTIN